MHRLPKIPIFHKKSTRQKMGKSRAGSPGATPTKPKPRLERSNASKNIDYMLPSTSSNSSDDSSESSSSSSAALRTRSLDALPTAAAAERTSFRIEGTEGECELILRSLGLSGPEDFAIPAEAWEAMKVRTSSSPSDVAVVPLFSRLNYSACRPDFGGRTENGCPRVDNYDVICPKLERFDLECSYSFDSISSVSLTSPKVEGIDFGCSGSIASSNIGLPSPKTVGMDFGYRNSDFVAIRSGGSILKRDKLMTGGVASDIVCDLSDRLGDCVRLSDRTILRANRAVDPPSGGRVSDAIFNESESGKVFGRSGIKGARPPALAPPPAISLPVIDNCGSTWDILKSFGPKDDRDTLRFRDSGAVSSDNEDDGKAYEEVHDVVVRSIAGGNGVLLGSGPCSFTTNSNDDDSSSTTTEPMSNNSPNGRFRCIITYWEKGELLGRGSFGSVYEGISDDGFFFAVKEVSLLDQREEGRQSIYQLEQEIALLSQFEHENIVQYYGTQKDESKLYIFLELVTKGSLLSLYQKYNLRDSQVSAYTRQILHGLNYLHDRDVVHRDIKCANILVDTYGSVKLADFGLAKATKLNDVKSCKGTPFWMAPEVVNRRNQGYGLAADIWSLGCTVLEMLTCQFPYSHFEPMQALFRIGRGERPQIPEMLSSDAQEFILKCLQVNPKVRPSAAQLLDHPFVKRPLPSSCLASPYHPSRRV